ncbi:MAG: MarR family transcriptional regulator [Bauldia sp.]|nr:MarR family transcriptional regulator [Bauldia sp.]
MADVIYGTAPNHAEGPAIQPSEPAPAGLRLADKPELAFIELLFFAYRDFVGDPDAVLDTFGFGRAHHRVLHFVSRNPGMMVADLLDILKITKQSLARVLKQLVDTGHIEQRPGPEDRRQRLLFPTQKGKALSMRLVELQAQRVRTALAGLGADGRAGVESFLRRMIDPADRDHVDQLIKR